MIFVLKCQCLSCVYILLLLWLVAVFFVKPTYEIDENKGPVKLRLRLDKSTVTEFKLQVYDVSNTANGEFFITIHTVAM